MEPERRILMNGTSTSNSDVLALVVTYEPGPELEENLKAICAQVGSLVVIDNCSTTAPDLPALVARVGGRLVRNSSNRGVAAALNQGAAMAAAEGFGWLAMFDQDSSLPPEAIAQLLALYGKHLERERIGILATSHRDRGTGLEYHVPLNIIAEHYEWRSLRGTITSGSMVRTELFDHIGLFDERLFIDFVDHDFCLRARSRGLLIVESRQCAMAHSIGASSERSVLGRSVALSNHTPLRRYYGTRNRLEVYRRFLVSDCAYSLHGLWHLAKSSLGILLLEPRRAENLRNMALGVFHFTIRRFGPLPHQSQGSAAPNGTQPPHPVAR